MFLSAEDLLVSDKLGDLYIFHLVFDNRSVQNIEVMKIGASVLASDVRASLLLPTAINPLFRCAL